MLINMNFLNLLEYFMIINHLQLRDHCYTLILNYYTSSRMVRSCGWSRWTRVTGGPGCAGHNPTRQTSCQKDLCPHHTLRFTTSLHSHSRFERLRDVCSGKEIERWGRWMLKLNQFRIKFLLKVVKYSS